MTEPAARSPLEQLLHEIAEQPHVVRRLLERQRAPVLQLAEALRAKAPLAVVLAARGSSDHAAIYGRYLLEVRNRALTSLAAPSTVTLYGAGPDLSGALVIGVSQSGRGEDVVTFVRHAREQGATTLALVNDASSPLAATSEWVLECLAGEERSVPATKTVTAQMTLFAMLSEALATGAIGPALDQMPEALERALASHARVGVLARPLASSSAVSVIGRGFAYPAALELALKLKETSYTRAEPHSAADFFHGPVALVEPGHAALLIDVGGRSTAPVLATAAEVARRGGQPLLLRAGRLEAAPTFAATLELAADVAEEHAPLLAVAIGQRVAVEVALARGLDPAQPRGLSKVTSTR